MYAMLRMKVNMRMDPKIYKEGKKVAEKSRLSFGRMTEFLWRCYLYPDTALDFLERLKRVEDLCREEK
mgnify:CR=1 FL=1|jgi:hypothetical protein